MEDSDLLGSVERHVVEEFKQAVRACHKNAKKLADAFETIDLESGNIDKMMLDFGGRETLIATIKPLNSTRENLSTSMIIPTILNIVLEKAGKKV